ncbi:MAG: hypothetical protein M3162_02465 [Thermoproteota archaeon]|nr:hypothetical protein [Thermoproteota archaeon]
MAENKNQETCTEILKISEKIRYIGIINKYGRTIAGKLKYGIKPLLTPDQARDERFIESTRQQLRKNLNSTIGRTLYTITKNENVTFVLIPSQNQDLLYYITIDKDISTRELNDTITNVLQHITKNC